MQEEITPILLQCQGVNYPLINAFRVDNVYYDNLQDAYTNAADRSIIRVLAGVWPSTYHPTEYLEAGDSKIVTIEGGYDPAFTSNIGGMSTISGRTNLNTGKVVMKQIIIR